MRDKHPIQINHVLVTSTRSSGVMTSNQIHPVRLSVSGQPHHVVLHARKFSWRKPHLHLLHHLYYYQEQLLLGQALPQADSPTGERMRDHG